MNVDNPYRSPQTEGRASERIAQRGYPYSPSATAYFIFTIFFALAILGASVRFSDVGFGARLRLSDPIAGFGALASIICFSSGIYVLARSWRHPRG